MAEAPGNPAPFSARVVAFTADIALAAAGYFLSLALLFRGEPVLDSRHGPLFVTLWTAAFLLYQAYMSCDGRRSAGKALAGLRVVDAEGQPLAAGRAALRSAAYLFSSVLDLGFLWALVDGKGRAWHDLIAGTFVVAAAPASAARTRAQRAGAAACLAVFAGLFYWRHVVKPRYERIMAVSAARASLEEMKVLQRLYFYGHGMYAVTTDQLSVQSSKPEEFKADLSELLDMKYGVSISSSDTGYVISARARDDLETPVEVSVP